MINIKNYIILLSIFSISINARILNTTELDISTTNLNIKREYSSYFNRDSNSYKKDTKLESSLIAINLGISSHIAKNLSLFSSLTLGTKNRDNKIYEHGYNVGNEISSPSYLNLYDEFNSGNLSYNSWKVGVRTAPLRFSTIGIYIAKETIGSNPESNNGTFFPHTDYKEDTKKLEAYVNTNYPITPMITIGISNILSLRNSEIKQTYFYLGEDNYVSFDSSSFEILTSPYIKAALTPRFDFELNLTRSMFKALNHRNEKLVQNSGDPISNVKFDEYSGEESSINLTLSYSI
ncbi:hypothetical protein LTQ03_19160 [Vibrio splendidus]|uniref:hypothetical protein n=1 Tax=Vibrio splendidus TaxID=29497 RepID=UPI001FB45092|nr:hypothetical protein [Vibrio splendidus]UOE82826.1 hypothetical protein LTQ03_19160 [Vibrio splendidus]